MIKVDLSKYNNDWYSTKANPFKRLLWYYVNVFVFNNGLFPISSLKVLMLKLFGAKIGKGVVIKPSVNIKYPWMLSVGNHTWIGENVWIDNLTDVTIGSNCCLSQGVLLLTGNHDYKSETFDLMVKPIILEDGVWLGAKSIVCPGVICSQNAVLTVGSIATKNIPSNSIVRSIVSTELKAR